MTLVVLFLTSDFEDKQTFFIKNLCDNINQALKELDSSNTNDYFWLKGEVLEKMFS